MRRSHKGGKKVPGSATVFFSESGPASRPYRVYSFETVLLWLLVTQTLAPSKATHNEPLSVLKVPNSTPSLARNSVAGADAPSVPVCHPDIRSIKNYAHRN
jgi:hypothetical protein